MKIITRSILACAVVSFAACSSNEEAPVETEEIVEEVVEEVIEEVVEEPVELTLEEKIQGKWQQTHQRCDENGENGEEMSKETFWEFDGTNVTWSSFRHPYRVENGQIFIGDGEGSPYEFTKETDEFVVLKAVKTNRFMRLVKVVEE